LLSIAQMPFLMESEMTGATDTTIRVARLDDVPALNVLITESARALSVGYYTPKQIDSAIRFVFGVDTSLIADGTYFVAEHEGVTAGCGGWSRRRALYGGDQRRVGETTFLDPATDAARVRAFFVAPAWARRGIGTLLLDACESAAREAGFHALELMATLPGVPLYAARGFREIEPVDDALPDGTVLPFVRMRREL
jgi:GNAT superfamily N-acetyltransferase